MSVGQKMSGGSSWSREEDIAFERALAIYGDETDKCWENIVAAVPGKTLEQIKDHYEVLIHDVIMIESGRVPLPDYDFSEENSDKGKSILESDNSERPEDHQLEIRSVPKKIRKKGILWTDNEHKLFLEGLEKYGRGDWRSISRNNVISRTPTQVASHAQKYFKRLKSKRASKKKSNIHGITDSKNTKTQKAITWQNTRGISQPSQERDTPSIGNTQSTQAATPQPSQDCGTLSICKTQSTQAATSQPSQDHDTPNIWKTQSTQAATLQLSLDRVTPSIWNTLSNQTATLQPTQDLPMYDKPSIWNTQSTQAISQPSLLNLSMHDISTIWNTPATQVISQSSVDRPMHDTSTIWDTQATQVIPQPSLELPRYGTSTIWNAQATQATQTISQPSLDLPIHGASNIWNTQATRTISQPSLDLPTYGTPNTWSTQAASQPLVNIASYGMPNIGQTMGNGPMCSPFGSDMNRVAPPRMAYGDQDSSAPNNSSVPSGSSGMGSMQYNRTYMP